MGRRSAWSSTWEESEGRTYLGVRKMVECLLIGGVGLLEVVHHEVAVAECAPDLSVVLGDVEHTLEELDRLAQPNEENPQRASAADPRLHSPVRNPSSS